MAQDSSVHRRILSPVFTPSLILGYGCYWAWTRLSWQSAVLAVHGDTSYVTSVTFVASAVVNVITVLMYMLFEHKLIILQARRGFVIVIASACMATGTMLTALSAASRGQGGGTVLFMSALLTGIGSGTLVLFLGLLFGTFNIRDAAVHTSFSWVFAAAVYQIVVQLPPLVAVTTVVILPLLLGTSLLVAMGRIFRGGAPVKQPLRIRFLPKDVVVALVTLFVYSVVFISGAALFQDGGSPAITSFGQYSMLGGGLVALLIGLAATILFKNRFFGFAYRPMVILAVAGLLAFPVLGANQQNVTMAIFGAGQIYLFIHTWIALSALTYRLDVSAFRVFGVAQVAFVTAVIVGVPLGSYFSSIVDWGRIHQLTLPLATSLVLITVAFLMVMTNEERIIDGWGLADAVVDHGNSAKNEDGPWVRKCKDVAIAYNLSVRETEILIMLAKGRSLPYIQEELHIASGTANTHMRHIYSKMDIHGRQQLIDLIESWPSSKEY